MKNYLDSIEDKAGELVWETQNDGVSQTTELIAIINSGGRIFQVQLKVTRDEDDFINYDKVPHFNMCDGELSVIPSNIN